MLKSATKSTFYFDCFCGETTVVYNANLLKQQQLQIIEEDSLTFDKKYKNFPTIVNNVIESHQISQITIGRNL